MKRYSPEGDEDGSDEGEADESEDPRREVSGTMPVGAAKKEALRCTRSEFCYRSVCTVSQSGALIKF